MNPAPMRVASGAPMMNPRASIPTTCVTPASRNGAAIASTASANSRALCSTGVMSWKMIPGFG